LTFCSFGAYAEESHISQAIMHAEAAAKADGGKAIPNMRKQQKPKQKQLMNTWMPASKAWMTLSSTVS